MRCLAALCAGLLLYAGAAFAQETPPPGSDVLGSHSSTTPAQTPGTVPSVDPQQNQRTTGTTGSTTGYQRNPDFAGSPPNPARGVQGQNPSSAVPAAPSATPDQFHPLPQKKKQNNKKDGNKGQPAKPKANPPDRGAAVDVMPPGIPDGALPSPDTDKSGADSPDVADPEVVVMSPRARLLARVKT